MGSRGRRRPRSPWLIGVAMGFLLVAGTPGLTAAAGPVRARIVDLLPLTPPDVSVAAVDGLPITSSAGYLYDSGGTQPGVAALGEILNLSGARRTGVTVRADFYAASVLVGSLSAPVHLLGVAWGSRSPFLIDAADPPFPSSGIDGFVVTVADEGVDATTPPAGGLGVIRGPTTVDGVAEIRWFSGSVVNDTTVNVDVRDVAISTWDAQDGILDVGTGEVDPQTIPPGGAASYLVPLFYDPLQPVARYAVAVDGATGTGAYVPAWDDYFDDVGLSPFRSHIAWMADEGITTGCAAGRYCPAASVPRDEMASFLARAMGLSGTAPDAFTDDEGNLHEVNIDRVAKAGITTGCGPGLYCPSVPVRRDQMASFLARAVGLSGIAPDAFTDDEGNIHELNINLVAEAGITTGCGLALYCPNGHVSRGQMAAFLQRAFD